MPGCLDRLHLSSRQQYAVAEAWRQLRIRLSVRRIQAAKAPGQPPDGATVAAVVRNGAQFLEAFFDHYARLGITRYCFLDNGSTDDGPARIRAHPGATLLRCAVPFQPYDAALRRFLLSRFAVRHWALQVDVDECFDFPGSTRRSFRELLARLDARGYDCMTAQMLDLFPDGALDQARREEAVLRREDHVFYDLSAVEHRPHPRGCVVPPGYTPEHLKGGIRRTAFGIDPLLTKHPLLTGYGRVVLRDVHRIHGARLADATAVLYHYKFTGNLLHVAEEAVRLRNHWKDSIEYRAYRDKLAGDPRLNLRGPHARRLRGADALVSEQFLTVGPDYREWAGLAG